MVRHVSGVSPRFFTPTISKWYAALLSAAALWAIFNCAYVYLALGGSRTYRIESSGLLFVALLLPTAVRRANVEHDTELPVSTLWVLAGTAVLLWLAIMAPLVTFPFLSDDYVFLGRYRRPSDLQPWNTLFRPLFAFVFWLTAVLGRGSTVPFHILGFVLHAGCAALVGVLVRRLLRNNTAGFLSFAVFLASPLQLEATLWVSGLQELLCAFFLLSAAVVYSRGPDATVRRALSATPFLILALLSKETAVGYLLFFPILDVVLRRFSRASIAVRSYALLAGIAVVYLIVRSQVAVPDPDFLAAPSRYFFKQFVTLPYKFFVQPWNAEAVQAPRVLSFALCAVALGSILVAGLRKRLSRLTLAAPLMVISFTLPLYTYFFVAPDLAAARYLYIPYAGWALLVADVLTSASRRSHVAPVLTIVAIVVGSLVALRLNLRPWTTASEVIAVMVSAIERQADPLDALDVWQTARGIHLTRRGKMPIEYQGVNILLNGYDEFVRFASGTRATNVSRVRGDPTTLQQ